MHLFVNWIRENHKKKGAKQKQQPSFCFYVWWTLAVINAYYFDIIRIDNVNEINIKNRAYYFLMT